MAVKPKKPKADKSKQAEANAKRSASVKAHIASLPPERLAANVQRMNEAKERLGAWGGRPTDYRPEYCQMIVDWFERKAADREPEKVVVAISDKGESYKLLAKAPPTIVGFACDLGVHRDTLWEWARKHPDFSVALSYARMIEERVIAEDGARGLIPPPVVALLGGSYTDKLRMKTETQAPAPATNSVTINVLGSLSDSAMAELQKAFEAQQQPKQIGEGRVIEGKVEPVE